MPDPFHHRNIRLPSREYIGKKAYFVTLCSANRRKVFTYSDTSREILRLLKDESEARGFAILAYCLMPDHLHFLADGLTPNSDLSMFLKAFRIKTSRGYTRARRGALWQKKFYDHIIRSSVSLDSVAWYIWLNPVRTGVAKTVGEFPFAGSFVLTDPFRKQPEIIWKPDWK